MALPDSKLFALTGKYYPDLEDADLFGPISEQALIPYGKIPDCQVPELKR
jgi:hypothetical protein